MVRRTAALLLLTVQVNGDGMSVQFGADRSEVIPCIGTRCQLCSDMDSICMATELNRAGKRGVRPQIFIDGSGAKPNSIATRSSTTWGGTCLRPSGGYVGYFVRFAAETAGTITMSLRYGDYAGSLDSRIGFGVFGPYGTGGVYGTDQCGILQNNQVACHNGDIGSADNSPVQTFTAVADGLYVVALNVPDEVLSSGGRRVEFHMHSSSTATVNCLTKMSIGVAGQTTGKSSGNAQISVGDDYARHGGFGTVTATVSLPTRTATAEGRIPYEQCPAHEFQRRELGDKLGSVGTFGIGSHTGRFLIPGLDGEKTGRLARVSCVNGRLASAPTTTSNGCSDSQLEMEVNLVYGFPGGEAATFCDCGVSCTDCGSNSGDSYKDQMYTSTFLAGNVGSNTPAGPAPTSKGACMYVKRGGYENSAGTEKKSCIQIGKKRDDASENLTTVVALRSQSKTSYSTSTWTGDDGDLVRANRNWAGTQINPTDVTEKDPYYLKSHGTAEAYFFIEYKISAPAACRWESWLSFNAVSMKPEMQYLVTETSAREPEVIGLGKRAGRRAKTLTQPDSTVKYVADPDDPEGQISTQRSDDTWKGDKDIDTKFFDIPSKYQKFLPRAANFKLAMDEVVVPSGKSAYWDMGSAPYLDIEGLHVHSTAAYYTQLWQSHGFSGWTGWGMSQHVDAATTQCFDSLHGHDGQPGPATQGTNANTGMAWGTTWNLREELWGLKLVDSYDCSAFVGDRHRALKRGDFFTDHPALEALKTQYYQDLGFNCSGTVGSNCGWMDCCVQNSKAGCESIKGAGGNKPEHQCMWVEDVAENLAKSGLDIYGDVERTAGMLGSTPVGGTCYPKIGQHVVDVKNLVGNTVNEQAFTFASVEANRIGSSYVSLKDQVLDGFFGAHNRRWLLQYTNTYGSPGTPCDQAVKVSFKSNAYGGICEPAGRYFCDNRADECMNYFPDNWDGSGNPAALYPGGKFWELRDGSYYTGHQGREYRVCNCLKEKETCYRKIGCTSTKKYQLIIQNCYEQGCGNQCNGAPRNDRYHTSSGASKGNPDEAAGH